jgi:hypothetical protein
VQSRVSRLSHQSTAIRNNTTTTADAAATTAFNTHAPICLSSVNAESTTVPDRVQQHRHRNPAPLTQAASPPSHPRRRGRQRLRQRRQTRIELGQARAPRVHVQPDEQEPGGRRDTKRAAPESLRTNRQSCHVAVPHHLLPLQHLLLVLLPLARRCHAGPMVI